MDLGLTGRVAIVSASTKGLGLAVVEALAAEGVRVVANGRRDSAPLVLPAGVEYVGGDIADPAVPGRLVDAAVSKFGRLDIVVGNAGGPPPGSALEITDSAIAAAFDDNMLSCVRLVRAALPHMRSQHWGRVCFVASSSVHQPIPNLSLSNVSRSALWAWAKTAAQDLRGDGITINLACPGMHETARIRELGLVGPAGVPADFGKIVTFLCSEPANFINGSAVAIDGGATLSL
jgi:3-oxoacyl-[acyl-carrier protein] reductase